MTKRVQIVEESFNGIQVGEKVMYISRSYGTTHVNYGFYRGTHLFDPVVEYFYRERKWRWVAEKNKYVQDKDWSIGSRRVILPRRRIFNCATLQKMFDAVPTPDTLAEMIEKDSKPG